MKGSMASRWSKWPAWRMAAEWPAERMADGQPIERVASMADGHCVACRMDGYRLAVTVGWMVTSVYKSWTPQTEISEGTRNSKVRELESRVKEVLWNARVLSSSYLSRIVIIIILFTLELSWNAYESWEFYEKFVTVNLLPELSSGS